MIFISSNIPVQRLVQSVKQVQKETTNGKKNKAIIITEDKKDKNDGNKAIRVEIKFFSDKASWFENNQGGLDGSLHQQGLIF